MSRTLESFHMGITRKFEKFRELVKVLRNLFDINTRAKVIDNIDFDLSSKKTLISNQISNRLESQLHYSQWDNTTDLLVDNIDIDSIFRILKIEDNIPYNVNKTSIHLYVKKENIDEIFDKINNLENVYNTNTIDCFNDYYQDIEPKEAEVVYFLNLTTINIESKMRELVANCNKIICILGVQNETSILKLMNAIEHNDISIPIEPIDYEMCCHVKMETFSNISQLYCSHCGKIVEIKGMVFEDAQFYSQEGKKTKHGRYDRIKTFHKWMDNILARGKVKISKIDLDKISTCIERDGLGKMGKAPTLTLRNIRTYLQELDITNYNCNASYLLAIFSGIYPPQLTVSDYNKITIYYKKVIDMYNKDPVGSNTPYCPYFIYKIIEELWPNDKVKLQLLNYIHLKKPNTLMKWDNEWRKICAKNSFIFRATDYTKFDDF